MLVCGQCYKVLCLHNCKTIHRLISPCKSGISYQKRQLVAQSNCKAQTFKSYSAQMPKLEI